MFRECDIIPAPGGPRYVSGMLVPSTTIIQEPHGSTPLAPAAATAAAAADALTDVYGDGVGPESYRRFCDGGRRSTSSPSSSSMAGIDSPFLAVHCSPCPATTSVWLHALSGYSRVLPALGFSGSSDYTSSDLRPFMSCSPDRLARHASHDFIWLSALTGVVGTFCTVFRAHRVPRFLRISRIPFLHALVAMFTMPTSP